MTPKAPTRPLADVPVPQAAIVCVGGCHLDVVARTEAAFTPGTSCPGSVVERPGGVARNVAALLAGTGRPVALVSRVGDDAAGEALLADLRRRGVDCRATAIDPEIRTGRYVAVHGADGELVAAVSALEAYDRLGPDVADAVDPHTPRLFADANLPAGTLVRLARRFGPRLAVDAISRAKATRIRGCIEAGALVFCNLPAAQALVGTRFDTPAEAAESLERRGARAAVVTGGSLPVAVLDGALVTERPVLPVSVVDVTGAGDALIAGTLAGLAAGRPLAAAVDLGIMAAAAALAATGALDDLPAAVLAVTRADAEGEVA